MPCCSVVTGTASHVPGPASSVTRAEALAIADAYTKVRWMPEERHVLHGPDSNGMTVQTPDISLPAGGGGRGWWKPGAEAVGMPYQWGGFDTPEMFLYHIAAGRKAGDIASPQKRSTGDASVSSSACGIDCSGFVSRCWRLERPVATKDMPSICDRLASWDDLRAGDILLNDRHLLMFARWRVPGRVMLGYEAGPKPCWRVNSCGLGKQFLAERGYAPWRYRKIKEE